MAQPSDRNHASGYLPLLFLLFAASGCSALIYETVWYQALELAIGMTAVSLGFLLATFMGGLCIGSLLLPRTRFAREQHPLRLYGFIELGIAICAVLVHFYLPLVNRIYIAGAEHGMPGALLRAFIAAVCLLPPTILMGASLPAIAHWIKSTPRGVSWWGLLYGGNTLGAVFGCLLAGFYLLRLYDMATATFVAAGINVAVALVSFALAARAPAQMSASPAESEPAPAPDEANAADAWPVYLAIALSGATALGAEVVWTRLLGYLFGLTVYCFSVILAVFLVGLAIGSSVGSMMVRTVRARLALGWTQMLLVAGIAWTAWIIAKSLPFWPINPLLQISPWHTFQLDMVRALWAILPPAILWGASFPLAVGALSAPGRGGATALDGGRVLGSVYAANTAGAIVGALAASLLLVPWIGTHQTQRMLLCTAAVSGIVVLLPYVRSSKSMTMAAGLAAAVMGAAWLSSELAPVPGELIAYGRRMAINSGKSEVLYTVEGRNSSVAITRWTDGAIEIDVNGHVEATTEGYDMKLQRMVGHLPAILKPDAKSVLGIGFGAGVSAGTFTRYGNIEHITICEIEPVIPPTSTRYFGAQNYRVYENSKTRVVFDDARHYLMTTKDKYDIIASDPLDVFAKGTAAIYSKEYFESVKRHLNPGGMFTLYVPLYESDVRTVKSELATFLAVFPNSTIWANTINGQGYDMVFMGHLDPPKIDVDAIVERMQRPEMAPVVRSLHEIGVGSLNDLLSTYAGRNADLGHWSAGAELNTDADLRLQYLGGWGINSTLEDVIYRQMLSFRRLPDDLFIGSKERVDSLMAAIAATGR